WSGIFLGGRRLQVRAIPASLVIPIVVLGFLAMAGGIVAAPLAELASRAAENALGRETHIDVGYHLDTRPENLLALATYAGGLLVIASRRVWRGPAHALAAAGERIGPAHWYFRTLATLDILS